MSKYRSEISQAEFERIERYLTGGMDGPVQQAFEEDMASNAELRDEVALQRRLMAAVEWGGFAASTDDGAVQAYPKRLHIWRYAAAAVAVFAVGFLGWWILRTTDISGASLYASYFYPDPGLPVAMSSTDRYIFYDGMVSYKEEKYDEAIHTWRTLSEEMRSTDTVQYYFGMAMLNKGVLDSAALYLEPILTDKGSAFRDKALWYRALIHVNRAEYAEAADLLRMLPPEPRVTEIQQKINQLE
ncbi:tol-pal system YbgF family protein [Parapedobacter sp. 2B3]|uniref:tetratricopeptide repeat protein n=1 Tax=Parapedobacter sp. 2B3 TaxID=3342381 RepID=UPI0035B61C4C